MSDEANSKKTKLLNFDMEISSHSKITIASEKITFSKIIYSSLILLTSIFLCITLYTSFQISSLNKENKDLKMENKNLQKYISSSKNLINIFTPLYDLSYHNKEHIANVLDTIFYPYTSDIITSIDELEFIRDIFGKVSIRLEYKSSLHGDTNDIFHRRTRHNNHQLVLIKTKNGNRFGGYTSDNFEMAKLAELNMDVDKVDNTAFVFNLDSKKVYNVKKDKIAVYCDDSFFIQFGDGDILIWNNFLSDKSISLFPENYGDDSCEKGDLTGGEFKFEIEELEIFHVNFYKTDFKSDFNITGRFGDTSEPF